MEALLDLAPCYFFSYGEDGLLVFLNNTVLDKLGYEKGELEGQTVEKIYTLPTRIFNQTHFTPLIKLQHYAVEIFVTLKAKDGSAIPVLLNAKKDRETGNILCVGILVENRKKFEDELVAARNAAEKALQENTELVKAREELRLHAEKLDQQLFRVDRQNAELQQFNRAVSHDLQEPLRKLLVFSDMLRAAGDLPAHVQNLVDKLLRSAAQMRMAVGGLQQYVWVTEHSNGVSAINLNELLPGVEHQVKGECGEDLLVLDMEKLPVVHGDTDQVRLLFYHLLLNAVQFRKEGKPAIVTVRGTTLQLNKFRNIEDKYQLAEYLRIQVSDAGQGFDSSYNEKVFGLFKRMHNHSGRGLGLALCRKIVENHGGNITASGEEGKGVTITIMLPMDGGKSLEENVNKEILNRQSL